MTGQEFLALLTEQEAGDYINNSGAEQNGRLLKLIAGNYDEINQETFDQVITDLIDYDVIAENGARHTALLAYRPQ